MNKITIKRLLLYPIVVVSLFFSVLVYSGAVAFANVGQCCNGNASTCTQNKEGTISCCVKGHLEAPCSASNPDYCRFCG